MTTRKEPYSVKALTDYIHKCRTVEHGVPHFIPHYGGDYFTSDLEHLDLLSTCWAGRSDSPVGSVMFTNTPIDLIQEIGSRKRDYWWLIRKYGTKKQIEESLDAPIYHKDFRRHMAKPELEGIDEVEETMPVIERVILDALRRTKSD